MINANHPMHVIVVVIILLCRKTSSFDSDSLSKDGNMMRCNERERKALLVFKQGVGNHTHDLLPSWKKEDEDCCRWKGVGCDNHTGHVSCLNLSSVTPPSFVFITSLTISHSLLDLPYLKYLDLSSNFIGGPIPEIIGSLTNLVHLDFSLTYALGIPNQIGNLSNLQYLNLSFNFLDGPIPEFIGSLNSLRYLDLSNSRFGGVIPHELENLSNLQHIDLSYNINLTGGGNFKWFNLSSLTHLELSYTEIATLSNLSSSICNLYLGGNYISSSIFNWLSDLSGSLEVLDLHDNVLEGRIPKSFALITALTYLDLSANQLSGSLPNSICNISNLKVVDFSSNNFTGNLEDFLSGPFPLLQYLWISENQLTGSLPDITLLSSLRELQVNSNHLNGYLPTTFKHHSALQILDLSNNHLKGSLPDFTEFSSLRLLYLYFNEFSESLPNFTGCTSLQALRLGKNQFTEWETPSIGLLSNLEELDLSVNSIHNTISEAHLSNLSSLKYLRTSSNDLTFKFSSKWLPLFQLSELSLASCKLGPQFPTWIQNQEHIGHLDISNSQISDTIPIWFWNLTSKMTLLNLSSNKIRGNLSWKYISIQEIDLSSNYLDGPLPQISVQCLKINLSQNKFSGTLLSISVLKDLPLRFLDISHNHLFGPLPDKWMHFQGLVFLNLGYNKFSGRIPPSIGNLVSLRTMILRNNKLHGELPSSLRKCSNLGFVDFGLNKLSGRLRSWIGEDLTQLYALILKSNSFYGSMPYEICLLSNLHFLDLSINRISGNIPQCIGNLTAMIQKGTEVAEHTYPPVYANTDTLALAPALPPSALSTSYFDNVLARWKGQEFEYGRIFAYLKMIDLSSNNLTGKIPIGITRLLELKGLNLSGNRFYGNVQLEIGRLKVLECLDLSKNKFSGEIPLSVSGLNFLAYLDLSNNNFSGRIPYGTQLQGFNISTYEGNTGLCGKPLKKNCSGDEPADHVRPSSSEYEVDGEDNEYERWLYISTIVGFSTTFWGIIGTLVLHRRWRHAYFFFLYNLKERIYVAIAVCVVKFQRTV